jgi:hypothetical protein
MFMQPTKGSADVPMLDFKVRQTLLASWHDRRHVGPFREVQAPVRMSIPGGGQFAVCGHLLECKGADGLQHGEADGFIARLLEQAPIQQRCEVDEDVTGWPVCISLCSNAVIVRVDNLIHSAGRIKREPADEYADTAEQALRFWRKQRITPGNRALQGVLAIGGVPRSAIRQW